MRIQLLAFGIAKDILNARAMPYHLKEGNTIAALKVSLINEFSDFKKLPSLAFAVNAEYVHDDYTLIEGDEVVLIPPVSGG